MTGGWGSSAPSRPRPSRRGAAPTVETRRRPAPRDERPRQALPPQPLDFDHHLGAEPHRRAMRPRRAIPQARFTFGCNRSRSLRPVFGPRSSDPASGPHCPARGQALHDQLSATRSRSRMLMEAAGGSRHSRDAQPVQGLAIQPERWATTCGLGRPPTSGLGLLPAVEGRVAQRPQGRGPSAAQPAAPARAQRPLGQIRRLGSWHVPPPMLDPGNRRDIAELASVEYTALAQERPCPQTQSSCSNVRQITGAASPRGAGSASPSRLSESRVFRVHSAGSRPSIEEDGGVAPTATLLGASKAESNPSNVQRIRSSQPVSAVRLERAQIPFFGWPSFCCPIESYLLGHRRTVRWASGCSISCRPRPRIAPQSACCPGCRRGPYRRQRRCA